MKECNEHDRARGCEACDSGPSRREFFSAAGWAAAALALMALPSDGRALTVSWVNPSRTRGDQAVYPLPADDCVNIDRETAVILVRREGAVYAFRLSCPHQRTALKWKEKDDRFECPKHNSKYRPDGTFISGRATRSMDRHGISLKNGELTVSLSQVFMQDKDPEGWAAALVRV